jgi:hypothetical protein
MRDRIAHCDLHGTGGAECGRVSPENTAYTPTQTGGLIAFGRKVSAGGYHRTARRDDVIDNHGCSAEVVAETWNGNIYAAGAVADLSSTT